MSDSSKSSSASSGQGPATSMAELMAQHASAFVVLKKGEKIEATVSKITSSEMFVLVNDKTEALVLEKDRGLFKQLVHLLSIGDKVEVSVLSPENDLGQPVVSLRHFMENKTWKELENLQNSQEKVSVTITDATKGGYLVESTNGISGFLPNSHVNVGEDAAKLVGRTIQASIVDLNKEQKKVIFSQKGIVSTDEFKKLTAHLKAGTKVKGIISGITTFGLFVSLAASEAVGKESATYIDGLVHISEVSWEKVEDLGELFRIGQEVDAVVVGTDADAKRIDLSFKRLSTDPFGEIAEAYPVDKKVSGEVTKVEEAGVTVDLGKVGDTAVEGFIKREKISPNTKYEVGQKINVTVSQIDSRKRKILLTPVLLEKPLMYR